MLTNPINLKGVKNTQGNGVSRQYFEDKFSPKAKEGAEILQINPSNTYGSM
jgi:hypothetical protein